MKDKTNIYNIIIYVFLVFPLSGLSLLLHTVFANAGDYSLVFPQFAPSVALVILLALRRRQGASFAVKRRFSMDKRAWIYCLGSIACLFTIFFIFRQPFTQWETPSSLISLLCIMAGSMGEEIGWRGFLLPALNRELPLILSALVVGIIWGAWHFDFENGVIGYLVSILFMTSLSIIMSWVQVKSSGSIIPAILLHFFINICAHTILLDMSFPVHMIMTVVFVGVSLLLFWADRRTFMEKVDTV